MPKDLWAFQRFDQWLPKGSMVPERRGPVAPSQEHPRVEHDSPEYTSVPLGTEAGLLDASAQDRWVEVGLVEQRADKS